MPAPRTARPRAAALRVAPILLLAWSGGALALPGLEYGPETEARFVERCMAAAPADAQRSACQRLMERLQAEHGYAGFLARAAADADPAPARQRTAGMAEPGTVPR